MKAQNNFSEVQSGRGMEADIEDDQDILEDGEGAEDAGFAVGDVPPVTKHAGQDGHQVEEQEDLLQHQYV